MVNIATDAGQQKIQGAPDECPFCHKAITPNYLYGHQIVNMLEVLLYCPNNQCQRGFLGLYEYASMEGHWNFTGQTTQGTIVGKDFNDPIPLISSLFVKIYNQAYAAEQQGLLEICGVGYRKALEFLIKDYIISNLPSKKKEIEKKFLGNCISDYVDEVRIKNVAKRAVWLGNDETHYVRIWKGKNLEDLKMLIDLTIHWIEMESLTKSIEKEMPDILISK